jgi:phosphatidylglycerol lysyltransferase
MRVYTAAGLSAADVGRVALFGSTAYGASICVVGAAAQVISPDLTAGIFGLSPAKLSIIAWGFLVWLAFLFYRAFRGEHSLGFGRFRLRMPGAGLMAFQLIIAVLDMVFTAACLYVLVPHHTELSFLSFLAASSISIAAGIVSQVPGGLGIFEGAILFAFRNDLAPESLAAALLAYRLIYTVLPLLLAVAVLAFREVGERLPAIRRAD